MSDRADRLREAAEIIRKAKVADPLLFDLRDAVMKMADWIDSYESAAESQAKRIAELEAEVAALRVERDALQARLLQASAVPWARDCEDRNGFVD